MKSSRGSSNENKSLLVLRSRKNQVSSVPPLKNTNRILFSKSLNVNMRGGDEKDGKPSTKNGEKGKPYTPAGYEESL
jgi:hypothetical protein